MRDARIDNARQVLNDASRDVAKANLRGDMAAVLDAMATARIAQEELLRLTREQRGR